MGDGQLVLDVPAKLPGRVRVYSQGHGRQTDADNAVSIAVAALNSTGVAVVRRRARANTRAATPDGVDGFVALDWEDGRIVGIEILDSSSRLSHDALGEAEHIC